jgi:hypothetical protein
MCGELFKKWKNFRKAIDKWASREYNITGS